MVLNKQPYKTADVTSGLHLLPPPNGEGYVFISVGLFDC